MVWLSTALGFILYNQPFPRRHLRKGTIDSLEAVTGKIGTAAILVVTALIYLVVFHRIDLQWKKSPKEELPADEHDKPVSDAPVYTLFQVISFLPKMVGKRDREITEG